MDDAKEVQGDEVMVDLPEDVGQRNDESQRSAGPHPGAAKVPPRGGEDNASDEAEDEQSHGVLGHHADADGGSDGEPPAWVVGGDEADDEPGDDRPPEQVERGVREEATAEERLASGGCSKRERSWARRLAPRRPAESPVSSTTRPWTIAGKTRKPRRDAPKSMSSRRADEDGEGRIFDVSPLEMLRVVEGLEFVAVKAILAICQKVENKHGEAADEETDVAVALRVGGVARCAVSSADRHFGGNSSSDATVHDSMLHQERTRITWIPRANVDV